MHLCNTGPRLHTDQTSGVRRLTALAAQRYGDENSSARRAFVEPRAQAYALPCVERHNVAGAEHQYPLPR